MEIERSVRMLLDPLWDDALKQRIPLYLQFEITSRCNLMCRMCYVASNCEENRNKELPASKWLDIARQARDAGMIILNITGGEPVMKEDFWEFYEGITNLGVMYTLNTNGTTMTKETVKRLAQARPFRALVSIYGGSKDTYAKVTTSGNWFDKAREGVENLLDAGIQTITRMTLIKDNIDDLPKVFAWANSLGQDLFYSDYMSPRREGDNTDPIGTRLDPSERIQAKKIIARLYKERDAARKGISIKPEVTETDQASDGAQPDENIELPTADEPTEKPYRFMTDEGFKCGAGRSSGFISYGGILLPCGTTNNPSASICDTSFSEAWIKMSQSTRNVPSCSDCDTCKVAKYCIPCPPKLTAESGSPCNKSEYLCEHAHKLRTYHNELMQKGKN